jgi:hypothetical protein
MKRIEIITLSLTMHPNALRNTWKRYVWRDLKFTTKILFLARFDSERCDMDYYMNIYHYPNINEISAKNSTYKRHHLLNAAGSGYCELIWNCPNWKKVLTIHSENPPPLLGNFFHRPTHKMKRCLIGSVFKPPCDHNYCQTLERKRAITIPAFCRNTLDLSWRSIALERPLQRDFRCAASYPLDLKAIPSAAGI